VTVPVGSQATLFGPDRQVAALEVKSAVSECILFVVCAGRRPSITSKAVHARPRVGQRTVGVSDGQWTGAGRRRRRGHGRALTDRLRRRAALLADRQLLRRTGR